MPGHTKKVPQKWLQDLNYFFSLNALKLSQVHTVPCIPRCAPVIGCQWTGMNLKDSLSLLHAITVYCPSHPGLDTGANPGDNRSNAETLWTGLAVSCRLAMVLPGGLSVESYGDSPDLPGKRLHWFRCQWIPVALKKLKPLRPLLSDCRFVLIQCRSSQGHYSCGPGWPWCPSIFIPCNRYLRGYIGVRM